MTIIDDQGRPEPPRSADELDTLVGFLEFQRATFAWKCLGLPADAMRVGVGVSTMTLGGLLKHMSLVEEVWFWRSLHAGDRLPPWNSVDWAAQPDWDWESAADDTPAELESMWRTAVDNSRRLLANALERGGLDQVCTSLYARDEAPNLRWILVHMIEEYARHNGHADLIRETIDGEVGE
ncbi:MAG: DinB family protein [Ilumatobacteraceae bacterium]